MRVGIALLALALSVGGCRHEHTVAPRECVGVTKPIGAQHGWHEDSVKLVCR